MNEDVLTKIRAAFTRAIDPETLMRLARDSGFCQRMRVVPPHEVVIAVITAMATQTTETIADVQRTFNRMTERDAPYKPFHKKLAKPSFAEFMRQVVCHLLGELVLKALAPTRSSALAMFDDILFQDGTSFALRAALKDDFPGRYRRRFPAAVELHATMSLWNDQPIAVSIAPDVQGERHFLPKPTELLNRLIVGDRGYQGVEYCREVHAHGGYVLIRHQNKIDPLVMNCFVNGKHVPEHQGLRLQDLMTVHRGKTIDIDAQWKGIGRHRSRDTRLRVVLLWHPEDKEYMALVTNLDRQRFSPQDIRNIYRLRWQVELLFKEWKSYCNLHAFTTSKAPIATGFMWAALAASILARFMAKAAQRVFDVGEISTRKTVMTISHHLYIVMRTALSGRSIYVALVELLRHLSSQALRAHPARDRRLGRLRLGIEPVTA